jgi:hypothetical protein
MAAGYQITGNCDPATGNGTGNNTGYVNVLGPNGAYKCYGQNDPAYLALLGTPALQCPPNAACSPLNLPAPPPSPLPQLPAATPPACTTPACLGLSTTPATGDIFSSAMAWIQANPLMAAGAALAAFFVLRGL